MVVRIARTVLEKLLILFGEERLRFTFLDSFAQIFSEYLVLCSFAFSCSGKFFFKKVVL